MPVKRALTKGTPDNKCARRPCTGGCRHSPTVGASDLDGPAPLFCPFLPIGEKQKYEYLVSPGRTVLA